MPRQGLKRRSKQFHTPGSKGRSTGVAVKQQVKKGDDGQEDVDDFFASEAETTFDQSVAGEFDERANKTVVAYTSPITRGSQRQAAAQEDVSPSIPRASTPLRTPKKTLFTPGAGSPISAEQSPGGDVAESPASSVLSPRAQRYQSRAQAIVTPKPTRPSALSKMQRAIIDGTDADDDATPVRTSADLDQELAASAAADADVGVNMVEGDADATLVAEQQPDGVDDFGDNAARDDAEEVPDSEDHETDMAFNFQLEGADSVEGTLSPPSKKKAARRSRGTTSAPTKGTTSTTTGSVVRSPLARRSVAKPASAVLDLSVASDVSVNQDEDDADVDPDADADVDGDADGEPQGEGNTSMPDIEVDIQESQMDTGAMEVEVDVDVSEGEDETEVSVRVTTPPAKGQKGVKASREQQKILSKGKGKGKRKSTQGKRTSATTADSDEENTPTPSDVSHNDSEQGDASVIDGSAEAEMDADGTPQPKVAKTKQKKSKKSRVNKEDGSRLTQWQHATPEGETVSLDTEYDQNGRPKRHRYPPLKYWKNEKPVYSPVVENGQRTGLFETKGVILKETPFVPKRTVKRTKKTQKASSAGDDETAASAAVQPEPKIITKTKIVTKQVEVPKDDLFEGQLLNPVVATVAWDGTDDMVEIEPIKTYTMNSWKALGNTGVRFCKQFAIKDARWSSGHLELPQGSTKPRTNTKANFLVFDVGFGRVAVTIANSTFRVGAGSSFFVPPGNYYSIANDSDYVARISFVQIKQAPA
eukprot:m.52531 g.52531  ORF g.52531 m.52531 type:complete len:759 (+) comp11310_c0_seq1:222-2498(+)